MTEYGLGDYRRALSDILKAEATGLANRPAFIAEVYSRGALTYLRLSNFPRLSNKSGR